MQKRTLLEYKYIYKTSYSTLAYEKFEDTKGVIKSRRTDDTMANRKRTNNDIQNTTHKT
jgi:hypothetical protein